MVRLAFQFYPLEWTRIPQEGIMSVASGSPAPQQVGNTALYVSGFLVA